MCYTFCSYNAFIELYQPGKIAGVLLINHSLIVDRLAGLDIKSQDAYELAVQGMLRPGDPHVPMIYGIKCIEFNPPHFTIGKMVYYSNVINKLNEFKGSWLVAKLVHEYVLFLQMSLGKEKIE